MAPYRYRGSDAEYPVDKQLLHYGGRGAVVQFHFP